jgi:hypothetical protein
MTVAASTAFDRLCESYRRILLHLGGEVVFRRLVQASDKRRGGESWEASGSPVTAAARRYWATRKQEGGVIQRYEKLAIERVPFEEFGGLSSEWQAQLAEGWTAIENVVINDDETGFEADLCPVRTS